MWCGLGAFPADARIARCTLVRFGVQLNPNPTTRLQLLARSAGHNQLWIGHLPVLQHGCMTHGGSTPQPPVPAAGEDGVAGSRSADRTPLYHLSVNDYRRIITPPKTAAAAIQGLVWADHPLPPAAN